MRDDEIDWDQLPLAAIPSKALFVAAFLLEEQRDLTWPTETLRWLGMTKRDRQDIHTQAAHSWRSLLKCPCLMSACRRGKPSPKQDEAEALNPLNAALHGGGVNPGSKTKELSPSKNTTPSASATKGDRGGKDHLADETCSRACCSLCSVFGRTLLRQIVYLSLNYNLLGTLLNVFLFIAVQGALISASNTSNVPVELIAAALLAATAGCTVFVEVAQAVMYTWWHQMALKVYCPDAQLSKLARKYVQSTQVKMQAGLRTLQRAGRRASGVGGPPPAGPPPPHGPKGGHNPLTAVQERPKDASAHAV